MSLHLQRHWDRSLKTLPFRGNYFLLSGPQCNNSVFLFTSAESTQYIFLCSRRVMTFLRSRAGMQPATAAGRHWPFLEFFFFFLNSEFKSQHLSWWQRGGGRRTLRGGQAWHKDRRDMAARRKGAAEEQPEAACTHGILSDLSEEFRRWLYNAPFFWRAKLIFGKRKTLNSEHVLLFLFWVLAYSLGHYFQSNPYIHGNWLDCDCICSHLPLYRKKRHN